MCKEDIDYYSYSEFLVDIHNNNWQKIHNTDKILIIENLKVLKRILSSSEYAYIFSIFDKKGFLSKEHYDNIELNLKYEPITIAEILSLWSSVNRRINF